MVKHPYSRGQRRLSKKKYSEETWKKNKEQSGRVWKKLNREFLKQKEAEDECKTFGEQDKNY